MILMICFIFIDLWFCFVLIFNLHTAYNSGVIQLGRDLKMSSSSMSTVHYGYSFKNLFAQEALHWLFKAEHWCKLSFSAVTLF